PALTSHAGSVSAGGVEPPVRPSALPVALALLGTLAVTAPDGDPEMLVWPPREPTLLDRLLAEVLHRDLVTHLGVRVQEFAPEHGAVPDDPELVPVLGLDGHGRDHRVLAVLGEVGPGLAHLHDDPGDTLSGLGRDPRLRVVLHHLVQQVIEVVLRAGSRR